MEEKSRNLKELLTQMKAVKNKLSEKDNMQNKNIVIYGAGGNGKWVYETLRNEGYQAVAFIDDKHFESVFEIPVMSEKEFAAADICRADTFIIISFYIMRQERLDEIKGKFIGMGIEQYNISYFVELLMEEYFNLSMIQEHKEDIIAAYALLTEEKSRALFYNYIKAIISCDANLFQKPTDKIQYFDSDVIPQPKNDWSSEGYFVDCGAYVGDTFEVLREQRWCMNYAGFEPGMNNFDLLTQKVIAYKEKYRPILFPCATSKQNSLVRFSFSEEKTDSPSSSICSESNTTIPCVSIDSVIAGIDISFIKMDVEGAEYDSLTGAKETIIKKHPDLAICTYHKTEDIWELINLINSYYPRYRYYLRSYYLYGRETVLYAINE